MAKILLCLSLCIITLITASGQALYEVPIGDKIEGSTLILEGKVIDQKSFWNPQHTMIYTSSTVEVYKVFKGSTSKSQVDIMTYGGSVGTMSIEASELLTLAKGDVGVFFCFPNSVGLRSPVTKEVLLDVYSSSQGFFNYNLARQTASSPFVGYASITNELYTELQQRTGRSFENKKPSFKVADFAQSTNKVLAVTSFSPTTVDAGALLNPSMNVLTINGSGFGLPGGTAAVLFDDANNNPTGTGMPPATAFAVPHNDPLIISWTDTQIQLRVPTRAGTGNFDVRDATGTLHPSPSALTVRYSILTATFSLDGINFFTKEYNLMNTNGTGGYTFQYSTSTAGSGVNLDASPAKATFQRAIATWREVNGLNFVEGPTTTNQAVNLSDNINTIMFDNANTGNPPLATGVLAVCFSAASMCADNMAVNQAQRLGFDIVIRNTGFSTGATAFTIGPCPPLSSSTSEIDLETVLLHELGHALNLGHINDPLQGSFFGQVNAAKLMHFSVVNSVRRTSPDYSAFTGANYSIQPQGNIYGGPCTLFASEMIPLVPILEAKDDCPASFPVTQTPGGIVVPFDLVHATTNKFVDPQFTAIRCDGAGTNVTNTAFYALRTDGNGGTLSVTVSGYGTTPVALASCPPGITGGAVTNGVQVSLYTASTCPAGQAFPAPIACRTFTGNGALTSFTGLAANTNYLLFLNGGENTKASFSMTFGGNALPINISDFRGEVKKDHNALEWVVDFAYDIKTVHLEHSADGVNFETLGEIFGTAANKKGNFNDYRPYIGNNYYRLAIVNLDGSVEYSKILLLKRKDAMLINIYPNPVRGTLNVEINSERKGKYTVRMHNALGQQVLQREVFVANTNERVRINTEGLSNGTYHVSVYDDKNVRIRTSQVTVQ